MTNLAILPIIIPLFAAIILAFTTKKVKLSRTLAKIFTIINLAFIGYITYEVFTKGSIILETGSWKAPFGIIFVADIFSIVIVLTSSILTTAIIFFATRTVSENKKKHYFYDLDFIGYITYEVFTKGSIILETGSWKASFGIIFVADIFSIVIVLTSSILTTAIIFFATRTVSENKEKHYFYALVFFLISGVSGA